MPADISPDIIQLTDDELLVELVKHGVDVGPITGTTRRVYQRKLMTLMSGQPMIEEPDSDEDYSDDEVVIVKPSHRPEPSYRPEPYHRPEIIPEPQQPPLQQSSVGYLGRKSYRTVERDSGDTGMTQIKHRTHREETFSQKTVRSEPKPATNTAPKRGMSVWVQLTIFIIVALLVFLVIRNMDPKIAKPLIGGSK